MQDERCDLKKYKGMRSRERENKDLKSGSYTISIKRAYLTSLQGTVRVESEQCYVICYHNNQNKAGERRGGKTTEETCTKNIHNKVESI